MSERYSFSFFMSIVDGHISHLTTVNMEPVRLLETGPAVEPTH